MAEGQQTKSKSRQETSGGQRLALHGPQTAEAAGANQVGAKRKKRQSAASQQAQAAQLALGEGGIGDHAGIIAPRLGPQAVQPVDWLRVVVVRMALMKGRL